MGHLASRKLYRLIAIILIVATIMSGCSKKEEVNEDNKFILDYVGTWSEGEIYWYYGGYILDISLIEDGVKFEVTYQQAAPDSRVAYFEKNVKFSEITSNVIRLDFENDGWDNAGTMYLNFTEYMEGYQGIYFKIVNTKYVGDSLPVWGISDTLETEYEDDYLFYRNEDAHEMMEYTMEEYYETYEFYEGESYTPDVPVASEIFANWGVTEQRFRDDCLNITSGDRDNCGINVYDIIEYPNEYVDGYFKHTLFHIDEKGVTDDGYTYYADYSNKMLIYDLRDDIYNPTLSVGNYITTYMCYLGVMTADGTDYACFDMLAVDKH